MQPIIREKSEYYARTSAQMDAHLAPPPWSLREKIALTCRILAHEGHESAIAGQITARGDKPGTYWMLGFGLGFDEARRSNIVLVDDDLNLLEGEGMVNPSNRFHLWIYRHRPSVNAIVHTHPPHISALSMIGRPLVASHMDTSMFHDDCAYLPEWPGPPVGDEEGEIIHKALGDKRTILLAHHGQLSAATTIEEACVLALFMERAAKLQLMAEAVAPIKPLPPALAREAHDYRLKQRAVDATFHYFGRRALKTDADALT